MTKKWKVVLLVFFSLVLILITTGALLRMNTKRYSPQATITFNKGGLNLRTVYCRPYKKGRVIFGAEEDKAIQPFGKYWRLGANDATTFETTEDIMFAGKPLKAGKYSIYAVPGKKMWRIGVNPDANRWGASPPDYDEDVISVEVPVTYSDSSEEQLSIEFSATDEGAVMVIKWENSIVKIPIN